MELSGWNVLATRLDDDPDKLRWFAVVPQEQYRVVGDWDVTGLRGTNSKDIEVDDDLFVPAHRFFSEKTWYGGETPGSATNPAPIFRLPLMDVGPYALTGVALGLARRALELAVEFVTSQKSRSAGTSLSGLPLTVGKIAHARHLVDVSEVTMKHWVGIAEDNAMKATPLSATDRVSYRSHAALAVKFALEAIDVLVPVYGARILARGSEIERILRDANAIRSNMALNLEVVEQAYGASLLQPAP